MHTLGSCGLPTFYTVTMVSQSHGTPHSLSYLLMDMGGCTVARVLPVGTVLWSSDLVSCLSFLSSQHEPKQKETQPGLTTPKATTGMDVVRPYRSCPCFQSFPYGKDLQMTNTDPVAWSEEQAPPTTQLPGWAFPECWASTNFYLKL